MDYSRCHFLLSDKQRLSLKAWHFRLNFIKFAPSSEVAREGSIRGASRALAVSQPALTKAIKELEEGLSAQLFVRRSQGVALTDNGESFYQHASLILEELRAAQDELLQRQGNRPGKLILALAPASPGR